MRLLVALVQDSINQAKVVDPGPMGSSNRLQTTTLVVDDYGDNRVTGSFVLIDEVTNATVAAGMVGRASFL